MARIKKYIIITLILALGGGYTLKSQDIHFSQFYASPLNLNPAMTGLMQGCYRGNVMYRNQWSGYTNPYVTLSATGDAKLLQNKLLGGDFVGAGLRFYNDKSGDAGFNITDIMLSGAYHKKLTENHQLGGGLQLGYVQKGLDNSELLFPQQYGQDAFNKNLPSGEDLENTDISYFDMQTGIFWSGRFTDRISGFGGGAIFHITHPKEMFLGQENRLDRRYLLHGGSRILYKENFSFVPNFVFMYQGGAKEVNIGGSVEYGFPNNKTPISTFSLGSWFRYSGNGDALILVAGVDYQNFKFGASYDITVSPLQTVPQNNSVGAIEFSLTYEHPCQKLIESQQMACPRF